MTQTYSFMKKVDNRKSRNNATYNGRIRIVNKNDDGDYNKTRNLS